MPTPPLDLASPDNTALANAQSIGNGFTPILSQEQCSFTPEAFEQVVLNLLKNPNITSSHLFRSDILYDSHDGDNGNGGNSGDKQNVDSSYPGIEIEGRRSSDDVHGVPQFQSFAPTHVLIRRLVPRNPQLDKPLEQSCHFLTSETNEEQQHQGQQQQQQQHSTRHVKTLVVCVPHAATAEEIPWYHPAIKALAYLYDWQPITTAVAGDGVAKSASTPSTSASGRGTLTLHFLLFPNDREEGEEGKQQQQQPLLPKRLQRTALNLLSTVRKHGEGVASGYEKKFHFDLLLPQARVQDTYAALKRRHARRLCDAWVEVTEPSKHVFEDLAIAAFLIELWRDLYRDPPPPPPPVVEGKGVGVGVGVGESLLPPPPKGNTELPDFPGFVDIGCGNGVLTEVLLSEGYPGWGFDARRRKTWAILSPRTKKRLRCMILVPQPLQSDVPFQLPERGWMPPSTEEGAPKNSMLDRARSAVSAIFPSHQNTSSPDSPSDSTSPFGTSDQSKVTNGLFPEGTFIISNHADELTPWTPLLAALSRSPFLAIPCCSHNLAGERFRAPSAYTGFTADAAAPQYFSKEKLAAAAAASSKTSGNRPKHIAIRIPTSDELEEENVATTDGGNSEDDGSHHESGVTKEKASRVGAAETGDLKALSPAARSRQPSAYASLCDWVAFLATEVGFEVEKDMLRIPSTRNVGIVCRRWAGGSPLVPSSSPDAAAADDGRQERQIDPERWNAVMRILERERSDANTFIDRARKLMGGKDQGATVHG